MASTFTTVLLLLPILLHHTSTACHVDDESALLSFKSGFTQDPSGVFRSWVPNTDCCSWAGVACYVGRVTMVAVHEDFNTRGTYLSGNLSTSLTKLPYLSFVSLSNLPNLTGPFPTFLSTLPDLQYLYLENTQLSGPIPPDIGIRFPNLVDLSLFGNRFNGTIPNSLGRITNLYRLFLGRNNLTGPIPPEIGQLRQLGYLTLEENRLSGRIPDFFNSFRSLQNLSLSHNMLSGKIPRSISTSKFTINHLDLGNNLLIGEIPEFIGNFYQIRFLDLSANRLTGTVPGSLKKLNRIYVFNLGHNELVDPFPELNITSMMMDTLDLSYNKFSLGQIPKWVAISPFIDSLKLAGCGLKFKMDTFKPPQTYANYTFIDFSNNQISGTPVKLLKQATELIEFLAYGNQLRFNISDLVIPTTLKYLNLSRNQVYGKVPASIARLEKLDLSHNHLCGQLPNTKFSAKAFEGNDCLCGSPLPACKN